MSERLDEQPGTSAAETQAYWRLILETANDAFIGMDDAGLIIDWNRRAEDIFGWSRAEVMGRSLAETVIPPDLRPAHWRGLQRFLETGEGPVLFQRVELPGLRRTGEQFDAEITIWPTRQHNRLRFNAFLRDISERKRMETHMRLLQRVAAAANAASSVQEVVRTALEEICVVTGWPVGHAYVVSPEDPTRLVPSCWWHLPQGSFEAFREVTERTSFPLGAGLPGRVFERREPVWVVNIHDDPNFPRAQQAADIGVVSGFGLPVYAGDEIVAVLEFFSPEPAALDQELLDVLANAGTQLGRVFERDRAERAIRAANEALERANRELREAACLKDQILSIVSHDLRTPLATVLGFARLLEGSCEQLTAQDRRAYLSTIIRQAEHMDHMVNDLLTVSRIEAGAVETHPASVQLLPLIEQLVNDLDLEVAVECPRGAVALVDRDHVTRILTNLATNADRYGEPPLRVKVATRSDAVEIRMCDHGAGVQSGFVPRLFEPFSQPGGSRQGSGLGLAIVRGLARANGGDAWYEPLQPRGACFLVRLPAA